MALRIAVLGGGVMGETLAAGFLDSLEPAPQVVIAEKRAERAAELLAAHELSIAPTLEAVAGADVVVVAVKPQDVTALLAELDGAIAPGTLILSIAAGITTAQYEQALPGTRVVRAMPNTPARIGAGMTGISAGEHCDEEGLALAEQLMSSVGAVVRVPESLQDSVTAVSGSGPAYAFYLAEAMIAAGVDLGLEPEQAHAMTVQTILGAALLMQATGTDPAQLRAAVTSPNGTTHAAMTYLEDADMREIVAGALRAARDRSRELSN